MQKGDMVKLYACCQSKVGSAYLNYLLAAEAFSIIIISFVNGPIDYSADH